jgi:hypothetical protein
VSEGRPGRVAKCQSGKILYPKQTKLARRVSLFFVIRRNSFSGIVMASIGHVPNWIWGDRSQS